jgi:hypothetical protein
MRILNSNLGWDWELTSFFRADNVAHSSLRAADFAARSGPLFTLRRDGICPMYHRSDLLARAFCDGEILRRLVQACPNLHLILLEPDHVHLEISSLPKPRRLDVVQFAARGNSLCGVPHREERTVIAMELR